MRVESSGHGSIQFYEDRRGSQLLGMSRSINIQREIVVVVMMIKLKSLLMQCLLYELQTHHQIRCRVSTADE